jgi:hypothetical protein
MACVAVILLTAACSGSGPTSSVTITPTPQVDKMLILSSGETSPDLTETARLMGLDALYEPTDENLTADMAWIGPLGESCIIVFFDTDLGTGDIFNIQVQTRYDDSFKKFEPDMDRTETMKLIARYAPVCVGDFDVNKLPIEATPHAA